MPYKKSYNRRPKGRPYGRYVKHAGTALDYSIKALTIARGIKKMINVEYKFHDVQLTSVALPQTPLITQLTNIAQGDTDQTRDGAQVKLTRLSIKLLF